MKNKSSFIKGKLTKWGYTLGILSALAGFGTPKSLAQTTDKEAEKDSLKNKTHLTVGNVSLESNAKISSAIKPVYNDNGEVIGQEKNGIFYYPEETKMSGDTVITTYGHGSFYNASLKQEEKTEVNPENIVPQKATDEQRRSYKERWEKLQKENNWTREELRAAQREEDREYREYLASKMSTKETRSVEKEALAVEKIIVKEIEGEKIHQIEYRMLPHVGAIPVITKDSWLIGGGLVNRSTDSLSRTPFDTQGVFGQIKSPSLMNREIIKIGFDIQAYKSFEYATIIPEYVEQDDEANMNAVDAFINKGGQNKRHLEAQLYGEIGYTFNLFKPKNDLDPNLYSVSDKDLDNKNRFKHLGAVKLRVALDGGIFYHEAFQYTVKENEWDPNLTYIMPDEQQSAEPGLGTYYGAKSELSINFGKVKRHISSRKTGDRLTLEEYQEKRQALLDDIADDAVTITATDNEANNAKNIENALKLMQLETEQKIKEFEENQYEVHQKRVGLEVFGGIHLMRTSFEPTNVAPFSNDGIIGEGEGTFASPNVNLIYGGLRLRF